ncbi:MAG: tetratricopeptide repeat protein [Pseudonocardiaceae bacterium]
MLQAQPESPQQLHRLAIIYHNLGMVAQDRGRLEDAERRYRQSLTIEEELGNRPGMATSFGQLGLLSETRERPEEAMEWTVRCVTLFDEFPHPMTGPGPAHLAWLTAELGIDTLERCWHRVTGHSLPPVIRNFTASGASQDEK